MNCSFDILLLGCEALCNGTQFFVGFGKNEAFPNRGVTPRGGPERVRGQDPRPDGACAPD